MRVSFDRKIVHDGLRTLRNLKCHVNLWRMINNVGIDFDILVTAILVKRGYTAHALMEKLVAKLPS